jgi:uncharacterized membrane protein YbhN (UPF0104 family)
VLAIAVMVPAVDAEALRRAWEAALAHPASVVVALAGFAVAFAIRAAVWSAVVPSLPYGQSLAAQHVSLGANHVLPLRLGEAFRVLSVVRRTDVDVEVATSSTVLLRATDVLAVAVLAAALAPGVLADLLGRWGWLLLGLVAVVAAAGALWFRAVRARRPELLTRSGVAVTGWVVLGSLAAWPAEALLVRIAAGWAGVDLGMAEAVLVTTVAVGAQTVAVAPSGIGTYEAAFVAAAVALGHDPGTALAAAITVHALKTAYSLVAGAIATVVPAPGLFGRLRLPRRRPDRPVPLEVGHDAPVVLFLPAHDEVDAVAAVVARAPAAVRGRRVEVVVVDDGSGDGTAAAAAAAGATVVRSERNHGLGHAVRTGLAVGASRGAAVVAFCDADGEYDPAELERLAGPILDGEADYVVGSRFRGTIRHMRPQRRAGNLLLTAWLRVVARQRLSDGQSGYRALSPRAARDAEVVHDYNYAQVLTLDLLGKGYRYAEVPIDYRFRTTGRSFVRLGSYLRRVVPAVLAELADDAATAPGASVLHDERVGLAAHRGPGAAVDPAARAHQAAHRQPLRDHVVGVVADVPAGPTG